MRVRRTAGAFALLAVLTACSGGGGDAAVPDRTTPPPAIPGVQVYTGLSHEHVAGHVDYPQHPPVGGPHRAPQLGGVLGWQACATYTEPVVDEFAVHSLEHGAVWITYQPTLAPAQLEQLRALVAIRPDYVLLSPYPGEESPITVTAWGLQLQVDSAADERLGEFVRRYAGGPQGGEPGADCAHGATPAQARAAIAAAG